MYLSRIFLLVMCVASSMLVAQAASGGRQVSATRNPDASVEKQDGLHQIQGTVTDGSGAVIAGANVQVKSLDETLRTTVQSDRNGQFSISGLRVGSYRLEVSDSDFESKEISFVITNFDALAPLHLSLAVRVVSTTISVNGREEDMIGIAESATQGTVGATELADRPILRSGEVLETLPGLIITQHAGGGKANQYFLRGFNLDHGTDFANFIDDMPLNLPSHAHGEGYSDMNIVIPEFVQRVNFEKGPYYANIGNFGAAGAAHMVFYKILPQNFLKFEGGMYGFVRLVFGVSHKWRAGNLLYGAEIYHDDGPWIHPDNYFKYNGLATYSQGDNANGASTTAHAYRGTWHSSDQIPVSATQRVGYFGSLNPTDGGHSQRYSLQGERHHQNAHLFSKITAYGFYYDLNLFSDFTYYLNDSQKGDQFEQQDRRWVAGLDAHSTLFGSWYGRKVETTFGLQLRNDWVHNGLFGSQNRTRTDKNDSNACNDAPIEACNKNSSLIAVLPAVTDLNRFSDTLAGVYLENKIQWTSRFRTVLGVRGDDAKYVVTSLTPNYVASELSPVEEVNFAQRNSGSASKFLPQPKLSLIFGPWNRTEFYAQGGFSYHSNDARGTTQHENPISPDNPFPTSSTPIPALVQLKGGEFGIRTSTVAHLNSTFSLWYLRSNSELQQSGDTGGTTASEQPSNRYGFEWTNYYTPTEHVVFDLDVADSRAQFTSTDSDDASFVNPTSANGLSYPEQRAGGKLVPEAVKVVIASGVTLYNDKGFSATMRLRYFGPRDLTSDGLNRSRATMLVNASAGYQFKKSWRFSADLLNLLDRSNDDITYAYISRVTPTATAQFTNIFHPAEPFQIRFWLEKRF